MSITNEELEAQYEKSQQELLAESKEKVLNTFKGIEDHIQGIDLETINIATLGILNELGGLLKSGTLDAPIETTLLVGGGALKSVIADVLEMYKKMITVYLDGLEGLFNSFDEYGKSLEGVGKIWKDEIVKHPVTALKLLNYKNSLKKGLGF